MTETPPEAVPQSPDDIWHVDFHMSHSPSYNKPDYVNCQIARGKHPHAQHDFKLEGFASFDGPTIVPPRVDQELIPYLLYHLDMVKEWLMSEHVSSTWNDSSLVISPKVGLPPATAPQVDAD